MPTPEIRPTARFLQGLLPMAATAVDGTVLLVNDALCRLVRTPQDQLVGRPADALFAGDRTGLPTPPAAGAQVRTVVRTSDGGTVPVHVTWTVIHDDDGAPSYLTAVLVDETERVRAEQELAVSEARWHALLAHAADVTWTGDADGTVTSVTAAVPERLGWQAEDAVGRSAFDLVHPDDVHRVRDAWDGVLSGSGPVPVEFRVPRGAAEWVWVRGTFTDLRADPAVRAVVANLLEITAERARARHDALWRARFEQSSLPQAMVDLTGRVTAVNDALCRLLGRRGEDLLGRQAAAATHPDDDGSADRVLAALVSGQQEHAVTERLLAGPDGTAVPVLVHVTVLRDADGQPEGAAAFFQDLRPLRETERRQAQQEEFFAALSARATDTALVGDAEGQIVYASPAARHVFGYTEDDVVGAVGRDFIHPDDLAGAKDAYRAVVEQGGTRTFVLRIRAADGQWRWVEETATNLLGTAIGGVVCNLRDVTDQVVAEEALRASEARYRAIAETADEGIWVADMTGRTVFANARMAAILGRPLEELYDRPGTDFLDAEQAAAVRSRLASRGERGSERYEVAYEHPDGGTRWLSIAATPLPDSERGPTSLAMVSDVTDQRRLEDELRHAALHDGLTGLPNRALLQDRLEHALARETRGTGVVVIDLDQFKLVNDSRGHHVGDELLVAVAQRLRQAVRAADTVARLGGDEFVVVCEDVDEDEARTVAADVLAAFGDPVHLAGHPLHVRASVGVAVSPAPTASDLLRYADTAMYAAKSAGRGRVRLFDRTLAAEAEDRFAAAADLRRALDGDELQLHFQPLVDLVTGQVVGIEALARWTHPERGEISPRTFVEIASITGLAPQLDRWALCRALREAGELRRAGALPPDAHVAVNLSARNLGDLSLDEVVTEAAAQAGLSPEHVVLEITESAVMEDTAVAVELLGRLRSRGFGIAIDDFGTGYSSLAYLRDLPITSLKVDRSFVAGIAEDRDAMSIVASIVDLARAVDVQVVAEGVETEEQAALLRRLGCRTAQGWLWSRAVPPSEAAASGWARGFEVAQEARTRVPRGSRPELEVRTEHGLDRLLALHREGASLATIAAALNREGFRTPTGTRWHRTTVARTVADRVFPALAPSGS